jgi:hypothetical protein
VRKVEDPEIRSFTLASGDPIHVLTDINVIVSLLTFATWRKKTHTRCNNRPPACNYWPLQRAVPVTHWQVLHKHTQLHTHAMSVGSKTLLYTTIKTPLSRYSKELCREVCQDPGNLNWLASSLICAPYSLSGRHLWSNPAGQTFVRYQKVEEPDCRAFYTMSYLLPIAGDA